MTVYGFKSAATASNLKTIAWSGNQFLNANVGPSHNIIGANYIIQCPTGIPALDGSTPGKATDCTALYIDDADTLVTLGPATVFNISDTVIESGKTLPAMAVGKRLVAINTTGDIDCQAICEKCGAFATPDGTCDPPPATETGCCDENCEFTGDSITNLLFTGSVFTYSQNGPAAFTDSSASYCQWTVPIGGSGPETQATVLFDFTNGWSVSVGLEGAQEATSSGCGSNSPINLTQGGATASFDQTSKLCYEDCQGDPAKCLIEEEEKYVKIGGLQSATGVYPGGGWFSDSIDSCFDQTCCTMEFTMKDDQTFLPLVPGTMQVAFDVVTIGSLQVSGNAAGTVFSDTNAQFTTDGSAGTMTITFSDSGVTGTLIFDVTVCNEPV